jgi:Holliday junction resolvasome RuvABC ATP-dependent DNA helicase subunit
MLRKSIEDLALETAKKHGHPRVQARHVVHAIAKLTEFRQLVEILRARAPKLLEPRGDAMTTAGPDEEAERLLAQCSTPLGAVNCAMEWLLAQGEPTADKSAPTKPGRTAPQAAQLAKETPEAVLADLDKLIGLTPVKNQLREVLAVVVANAKRREAGLPEVSNSLHLVFSGSPGTGKTTVARIVARLYAACGALKGSKFLEVHRSGLVGEYVGQTAPKTQAAIDAARPGVLFIDEAYSLVSEHGNDYGHEAVSTLVKSMEDHRSELAVIVAGYSEEMAHFVDMNPGLRSRFKTFIEFPDYSPSELTAVFAIFAQESKVNLAEGVLPRVEEVIAAASRSADFGNARFARSLWERAFANMAVRAHADGQVDLHEVTELLPADIPSYTPPSTVEDEGRIGFRS